MNMDKISAMAITVAVEDSAMAADNRREAYRAVTPGEWHNFTLQEGFYYARIGGLLLVTSGWCSGGSTQENYNSVFVYRSVDEGAHWEGQWRALEDAQVYDEYLGFKFFQSILEDYSYEEWLERGGVQA